MPDDMGTFRVNVEIENPARPGERRTLTSVLVDTGAELSWVPAEALESLGIAHSDGDAVVGREAGVARHLTTSGSGQGRIDRDS